MLNKPDYYLDIKGTAIDGNYAGGLSGQLYSELRGWVGLSLLSLAIAGCMALFIAFLRVPFTQNILNFDTQGIFEKGLITHVTFAFVIWYFSIHGALTILVSGRNKTTGKVSSFFGFVALFFAYTSMPLLLIPNFINIGLPSPNNYIPIVIHPLFFTGLIFLTIALLIIITRLFLNVFSDTNTESAKFGITSSGVIFYISLICLFIAFYSLDPMQNTFEKSEQVFWGMGHIVQFSNTLLMFVVIQVLSRMNFGVSPLSERNFKILCCFMVAGASIGPMIYFTSSFDSAEQIGAFTNLYWYVMPLPIVWYIVSTIFLLFRFAPPLRFMTPEIVCLWITILLFAFGGFIGFFGGFSDTRTPAHYHAMLVAVTLVFMSLNFGLFFPLLRAPIPSSIWRTSTYIFLGAGQILHSFGLYWAGLYGIPRKVSVGMQIFDNPNEILSLSFMGFGGLLAVAGGVLFTFMSVFCFIKIPKITEKT